MKPIRTLLSTLVFATSLTAFAQDVQNTDKIALSPQQVQFAFSTQGTPLPLIVLTEGEMRQTKGAAKCLNFVLNGVAYSIPVGCGG